MDVARLLPGPMVQLLTPDGERTEDPRFPADTVDLWAAYRWMVVARAVDDEAVALQRQGQLGTYSPCRGQEAIQVASASVLGPQDWIFPAYRELAASMVRGVDPADLLQRSRGTWLSGYDPYAHRVGLITVPIATQTLHAVGFAMGARRDRVPLVVLTYLGDGATSEGDAHEAMNIAAVEQAPCVFVVQNNGWAISVPTSRQYRAASLAYRAVGYGMPGVVVDGNDIVACSAVCRWAVDHARSGGGPVLIEAITYRLGPHTTSDDPTRYRTAEEVAAWEARDPIRRVERHLRRSGRWDPERAEAIAEEAAATAARVRRVLCEATPPDPAELFAHVFVEPTVELRRQAEELLGELGRQDGDG